MSALCLPNVCPHGGKRWAAGKKSQRIRLRWQAAAWFAAAALIPDLALLLLLFAQGRALPWAWRGSVVFTLPVVCAGLCGFLAGWQPLDPGRKLSQFAAVGRGVAVAGLAFVLYAAVLALLASLDPGDPPGFLTIFLLVLAFGGALIGWLVLLAGGLAGWLMHRRAQN